MRVEICPRLSCCSQRRDGVQEYGGVNRAEWPRYRLSYVLQMVADKASCSNINMISPVRTGTGTSAMWPYSELGAFTKNSCLTPLLVILIWLSFALKWHLICWIWQLCDFVSNAQGLPALNPVLWGPLPSISHLFLLGLGVHVCTLAPLSFLVALKSSNCIGSQMY